MEMIPRRIAGTLRERLGQFPAVGLLGPRQSGKTTLAQTLAAADGIYLDLESPVDREKLSDPVFYLTACEDKLVILDEVQRVPDLFAVLRGLIDAGRRRGRTSGRFLLLGSASGELLRQSETLAGRIVYVELGPFDLLETQSLGRETDLWVRGGFPESFLSSDASRSLIWRQAFIKTYLERDIPQFGPRIPATTLHRFWTMLAHVQGGLFNAAQLARGLAVDGKTVARYLDLLVDLMLVRRLPPWQTNAGKRLVKAPKVYVRDSGIVHALLGIGERESLLGHPVVGASWEGFAIENLVSAAPAGTMPYFYRTTNGAEIDLLLEIPGRGLWAIEIKRGLSARPEKGFFSACDDVKPERRFVVNSGHESYRASEGVDTIGLVEMAGTLAGL